VPSIAVILNGSAGAAGARQDRGDELRELFHASGQRAEIISLRSGQSPTDAAHDASARASIVVAGGGDGTVSSVAPGILDSPAALGVIPLGTLNHFAKDLGIPLELRDAVEVIAAGHVARVDVGRVNDRIFINNSSIGVYPDIVQTREALRQQGHRKFSAMLLATLGVLHRHQGVTVKIDIDGRVRTSRTPFLFVGNNEYATEGLRIGGRSTLDQGELCVYLAPRTRTRELPLLLVKALLGRATQSGAFEAVPATRLTVAPRTGGHIRVALDGEVAVMRTPLEYRTLPGALRVVRPRPDIR
jgi:diacylglycerol kinase family enzyme